MCGFDLLQVLHSGRHNMIRQEHKEVFQWLEKLRLSGNFIIAPAGSNDDWYWMYAAVMAREKGMLVRVAVLDLSDCAGALHQTPMFQSTLSTYTCNLYHCQPQCARNQGSTPAAAVIAVFCNRCQMIY